MSNLQDRLDKFKRTFESGAPPYNATREAIIRAADVNADYTIRPEPSETVRVLRALTA